jgi:putative PIG3 family NAD(P)H quinone oxidoreductase
MRAVRITQPGGPEVLELSDVPDPVMGPEDLLVRVASAGVNRADLLQRQGRYPAPAGIAPDIPGLEFAGRVEAAGARVRDWAPGDRVMGLVGGAAYAEYVVVRFDHALPVPAHWSDATAAGVPEAYLTAHDALHQVGLERGERVLIHAVGSSVGLALFALARARGAVVTGTSRTAWKLERAAALGVDTAVRVEGVFDPGPALENSVDVVCDLVGGSYLGGNLEAAAPRGRVIVIGLTAGRSATIDLGTVLRKRLTIIGTALRSRSDEEKASLVRSLREEVVPEFARDTVVPVIDRTFPMAAAADAHRYVEDNRNFGSVVLTWGG